MSIINEKQFSLQATKQSRPQLNRYTASVSYSRDAEFDQERKKRQIKEF